MKNNQQLLINFQKQGVSRTSASSFGRELNQPVAFILPVNIMLDNFEEQGRLLPTPAFFGHPTNPQPPFDELALAEMVNNSLSHIDFEEEIPADFVTNF